MYQKTFSKTFLMVLLGVFLLSFSTDTFAQRREKKSQREKTVVVKKPDRHSAKVVKLPAGHKTIVVGSAHYYYHQGVFYERSSSGYMVVRAPVGARIAALPAGYLTVHIGAGTHYYYYGTYYRYDPVERVYVVIEPPQNAEEILFDKIRLVDGSTLEGIYLGGSRSIIQFEAAGEIYEIPVKEVVAITFTPPVPSNED